jgi:hypothetical protein
VNAMSVQLTFGSVEVNDPTPEDLAGLLCGPGEVVRSPDGAAARVSVVVSEAWRVTELLKVFESIELTGDTAAAESGGTSVRTPFSARLKHLADLWTQGAVVVPPTGFHLSGIALRAWLLASGGPVPGRPDAWQLGLGPTEEAWPGVGAALAQSGLPGLLVGPRSGGPAYRVVGARRVRRLAELVGESPRSAPLLSWPTAA